MSTFRIYENSLQERFQNSRAPIQIFGGGFGNGKTANSVVKGLKLAKDYPGSNGLIARATLPKLNDTIRAEWLKWCPNAWIKNFPRPADKSSTCVLKNQSVVNFRYIAQQGKSNESSTSNLLSATYDWVIIDQMEDPEITHKDFLDLLGRLRGQARYIGDDPTMPRVGPGWLIMTVNPTRNWFYKKLVKPLKLFQEKGIISDDLLIDQNGVPLIELFEGSTYENKENLPDGFIQKMEAAYHGVMRSRFLMGQWGGFEGLVYPEWDATKATATTDQIRRYINKLALQYKLQWLEGFDFGIASPSCYMLALVDPYSNVIIVDGFYEPQLSPEDMLFRIKDLRRQWTGHELLKEPIYADPSIFKRKGGDKKTVGASTADLLRDKGRGVRTVRGNNDILNGIIKASTYMVSIKNHRNPFTHETDAPYLYVNSDRCPWFTEEIDDYYWDKDSSGEPLDKPKDGRDHALDTLRYMLSKRPQISGIIPVTAAQMIAYMQWTERDLPTARTKQGRYK